MSNEGGRQNVLNKAVNIDRFNRGKECLVRGDGFEGVI
jgi:hypothetical protein